MVHYIRFLRVPQVRLQKQKNAEISAVLAVTTDLGDAFFSDELALIVHVIDANNRHEVIASTNLQWTSGARAVKTSVPVLARYLTRSVTVCVTTEQSLKSLKSGEVPAILDVWSPPITLNGTKQVDSMVERRLLLPNKSSLRILEETGDSIARHIWDASLGFLLYYQKLLKDDDHVSGATELASMLTHKRNRPLSVLELGAGCGIVGIALAQMVKCDLVMTDLDDAQAILRQNSNLASPALGTSIRSQVLDWSANIEDSSNMKFDLVLVSDCIYNPDSTHFLVETLRQLTSINPHVLILVGYKRRHENDQIFFDRIGEANFATLHSSSILLPHLMTDFDESEPTVEFSIYKIKPQP